MQKRLNREDALQELRDLALPAWSHVGAVQKNPQFSYIHDRQGYGIKTSLKPGPDPTSCLTLFLLSPPDLGCFKNTPENTNT